MVGGATLMLLVVAGRVKSLHLYNIRLSLCMRISEAKSAEIKCWGERAVDAALSLEGLRVGADCLDHYSWAGSCAADAL